MHEREAFLHRAQQTSDGIQGLVLVAQPVHMIRAFTFDVGCSRDVIGKVSSALDRHDEVIRLVNDKSWQIECRQSCARRVVVFYGLEI